MDDNRNIQKLYTIMDLARQKQSIEEFIINLKIAYHKLAQYHYKIMVQTVMRPVKQSVQKNAQFKYPDSGETDISNQKDGEITD